MNVECRVTITHDCLNRWHNNLIDSEEALGEGDYMTFAVGHDGSDDTTEVVVCVLSDDDRLPYYVATVEMPLDLGLQEELLESMLAYYGRSDGITMLEFPGREELDAS